MKKILLLILFYSALIVEAQVNIETYEYWFNQDFDSKTTVSVAPQSSLNLSTSIPTAALPFGLHHFNFRVKDSNNKFSSTLSQFFLKLADASITTRNIIAYEYWIDNNFSNAIMTNSSPDQILNLNEILDVSSLNNGVHTFSIRFKDDSNLWSSVESSFFLKLPQQTVTNREIVAYEYWIGNNYNNPVLVNVTPSQTINLSQTLDFSSLGNGIHLFNIRFKDNTNLWSSPLGQFFVKLPQSSQITDNKIFKYRYWINHDFNNAVETTLDVTAEQFVLIDNLDFTQIPKGSYTISFQFRDSIGLWSSVLTDSIEKISLPIADFEFAKTIENCNFTTVQFTNNSIDGDEYTWDFGDGNQSTDANPEHTYTSTGIYTVTLYTQDTITGADSTFTQQISIIGETTGTLTITECDTYLSPAGNTYTETGVYNDTLIGQNIFSCDSILTINLTINHSVNTFENLTSCNPADTGTFVFTEQTQLNCDSVHTLTVSLLPSDVTFENLSSCNPADTGVIVLNLENQFLCDSVHTIITTLLPSNETFENLSSCNPADTGIVVLNLQNQFLCDSVHTITTTFEDWDIDVTVLVNNNMLTAIESGLSYQWINCNNNQAIPNATSQSFTATENGSYAVILDDGNCEAISDCYTITGVSIKDDLLSSLKIYPNPTKEDFTIDMGEMFQELTLSIFDLQGKQIHKQDYVNTQSITTSINGASGVYLIKIQTHKGNAILKLIKE